MAAPPPDTLIAALLAAVLGVFAPATGFVVTVLKPASSTVCSPAARNVVASTTSAVPGADWQELAAKLSGQLADSDDPEAQKLAQAIGDTGTPDTTAAPTTRTRSTAAPSTSAPGASRPMPGDTGDSGTGDSADTAAPAAGPCPTPSGRNTPATGTPSAAGPPSRSTSSRGTSSGAPRPTPQPDAPGRNADQRWEQLAAQLAAALAGSTDPRAADLQEALDRAGFPAARTTAVPEPDDPGGGG